MTNGSSNSSAIAISLSAAASASLYWPAANSPYANAFSIEVLAYRGTLVSVGVAGRSGSELEAKSLWAKNNTLRGVFLGGAIIGEYPRVHGMIQGLIDRVASGELRVEIDREFPLAEAAAAHAYLEGRNAFGRVVMTP